MKYAALTVLLICVGAASAGCPERMQRDPTFVALAMDDNARRPSGADDFKFIGDTTTLDELQAKVGPPDGTKGEHRFLWCLASGSIIEVESRTGADIRSVRVDGKTTYKRK
jgi:hypothetical protein